jgi:hypothetical protein
MTALVVPTVARFAVNQRMANREIVNILDVQVTPFADTARSFAVEEAAKVVLQRWSDNVRPNQSNSMLCESVSYVDLHSLVGTTGEVTQGSGAAQWPLAGPRGGQALPTNVAALVNKSTSAGRGSKSGRLFFTGLTETDSGDSPNTLTAGAVAAITNGFSDLRAGINAYQSGQVGLLRLVVVHTSQLTPGQGTWTLVTAMSAEAELSTQSRRIRRQ